MSMNHPAMEAFDMAVHRAICRVDRELEARHGEGVRLRPNRPAAGTTSNPQMDGLFNIGLSFTPGYGSELGRGYWLDLEIGARQSPDAATLESWTEECRMLLEKALAEELPGRGLRFERDGGRWKLRGDLSLGPASAPGKGHTP